MTNLFLLWIFLIISIHSGNLVTGEKCDDGQTLLNNINFMKCKTKTYNEFQTSDGNISLCLYAENLVNECSMFYEKCYSGDDFKDRIRLWLDNAIGMAFLYDKDANITHCEAFMSYFSPEELDITQLDIHLDINKDKKCEHKLDYHYDALVNVEYNHLDKIMQCANKCNETIIAASKTSFDSCRPGPGRVRDDLRETHDPFRYEITCEKFEKYSNSCSPILNECVPSDVQELIIGEDLYVMYLGVLDGLQDGDTFKIEDCQFFGGYISDFAPLKSSLRTLLSVVISLLLNLSLK